jgi:hypothetical protein
VGERSGRTFCARTACAASTVRWARIRPC